MSIKKYWLCSCDYCGTLIASFDHKPSREDLSQKKIFLTATKVFCSENCWGDWQHDLQQIRYLNINKNGKIHTND